jgi:hypothetical protein
MNRIVRKEQPCTLCGKEPAVVKIGEDVYLGRECGSQIMGQASRRVTDKHIGTHPNDRRLYLSGEAFSVAHEAARILRARTGEVVSWQDVAHAGLAWALRHGAKRQGQYDPPRLESPFGDSGGDDGNESVEQPARMAVQQETTRMTDEQGI